MELSNHHRRSPSISVAEIIFTATDCFIWRKHHHRNHNHWWMITQSELRTQYSHSIGSTALVSNSKKNSPTTGLRSQGIVAVVNGFDV
ncbi:hypothetical protein P8452_04424 [Trifolium repens]|nr:hypothetical protein P8452_04424 [Trifolium repens]